MSSLIANLDNTIKRLNELLETTEFKSYTDDEYYTIYTIDVLTISKKMFECFEGSGYNEEKLFNELREYDEVVASLPRCKSIKELHNALIVDTKFVREVVMPMIYGFYIDTYFNIVAKN